MKENFLNSKTHWTLLVFVCLVGLTALRAGFSGQSAEISALEAAENRFSEEELRFIADAESAADPEAFRARAKKLETFIYTDTGGLDARNPFCERFIDPDGNYGIYGHVLSKYLQEKFRENISTPLFADDIVGMKDSPAICPRWRSLTIGQKTKFWVWVMASIAMVESTCGHHKSTETGVRGTVFKDWRGNVVRDQNGKPVYITAIGLMQIEKERVTRAYRDTPDCQVSNADIARPWWNLRCGLDIMQDQISAIWRRGDPRPIYWNRDAGTTLYWQELNRPKGGKIGKLIRLFKPCYEAPEKKQPNEKKQPRQVYPGGGIDPELLIPWQA